jgi:UbiD family decarboxylase
MTPAHAPGGSTRADDEPFRLRRFVRQLDELGELETIDAPVDPCEVAARLNGNPKAVLFRKLRGCAMELAGNVMGTRRRLALAFGVPERDVLAEVVRRAARLVPPVRAGARPPVQEVVWTGTDADLTRLPVHLQHAGDGSLYISAGIDIGRSIDGARRNVGYRRLMLRGRREAGVDLVAPSDLRAIYGEYVARKRPLPIAFVIGSHPADAVAAAGTWPATDEVALMGALRGAPVPMAPCVTIDAEVPADAEVVLEGTLDPGGWSEMEGPYGELYGYYGHVKHNPVFRLEAITCRRDALFQTLAIGGRHLALTDTAQLNAIRTEAAAWAALATAVREPVAVYAPPSSGGVPHLRIAIRQRHPGDARNAIAAALGSLAEVKHVFVVDPNVDVFSDAQMEWALATRFQADRDLVVLGGMRTIPLDPSLGGARTGAKAGFDLTLPPDQVANAARSIPEPPDLRPGPARPVADALAEGPMTFGALMEAAGSRDGRDVLRALEDLAREGRIERLADGRYGLVGAR